MSFDFSLDPPRTDKGYPVICVYGAPKHGKSTAVALACPDYLWLVTNPGVLDPLRGLIAEGKASTLPKSKTILELTPDGQPFDTYGFCKEFVGVLVTGWRTGKAQSKGLVIDEFSTVLDRVHRNISSKTSNPYEAISKLKDFVRYICQIPRIVDRGLVLISHEQLPKYIEEGPNAGELLAPGGPKVPIAKIVSDICQEMDVLVQTTLVRDGPSYKRIFKLDTDPKWIRGIRDFKAANAKIEGLDLAELIKTAGYRL